MAATRVSRISQSGSLHPQAPLWSWVAWWISLALDWMNERSVLGWFFGAIVLTGLIVSFTGVPGWLLGRLAEQFAGGSAGEEEIVGDRVGIAVEGLEGAVDQDDDAVQEDPNQMSESRYQRWLGLRRQIRAEEAQRTLEFDEEGRRLLLACRKMGKSDCRVRRTGALHDQAIPTDMVAENISKADSAAIGTQAPPENASPDPVRPVHPLETAYHALVIVYARLDMILAYARRPESAGESSEVIIADIFGRDEVMDWARSAAITLQQIAVLSSLPGTLGTPDWSILPNDTHAHIVGLVGGRISGLVWMLRLPLAFSDCPDDYRKAVMITVEAQTAFAAWYGISLVPVAQTQAASGPDEHTAPATSLESASPAIQTNADIVRSIADKMKQLQAWYDPMIAGFKWMPEYEDDSEDTWAAMEQNEQFRLFCSELAGFLREIVDHLFTKDDAGRDVCSLTDQELDDAGLKIDEVHSRPDDNRMTVKSLHSYFNNDMRLDKASETEKAWCALMDLHFCLHGGDL
ncbi:hypothetical protein LTR86_000295 [Recurvomyces mirabilis]|nr:hypothetical protein LTR86_000295 [Recurvomyces mirabilis]